MAEGLANIFATTVGTGGIAAGTAATSLPVVDPAPTALQGQTFAIIVGAGLPTQEIMEVTATGVAGASPWTVTRASEPIGSGGTQTASAHSAGESVSAVLTAGSLKSYVQGAPKIVTAAYTCGLNDSVILADATGQKPPAAVSATPVASGGTFAARTQPLGYYWAVTAVGPGGESIALPAGAGQGIVANGSAVLNWQAAPGATSYKIYRSTFATNQYPPIGTLGLVASGVTGTTYTDTGTATSAGTPPATNGAAFTITLPDATAFRGILRLKAIGDTPNLVTVASVSSQQIGSLGTSITLGQVYGANFLGVELVSDGAQWRIVSDTPTPLWYGSSMGLNAGTITPAGGIVPVAIVPIPGLGFGQRLKARASCQLLPAVSATEIVAYLYFCTSSGAFQGFNTGLAGTMNGSQLAFWYLQNFSPGEYAMFAANWGYNPRPGDYNVEGAGWGGYAGYLGLFVSVVGGNTAVVSSSVEVDGGAIGASYFGPS